MQSEEELAEDDAKTRLVVSARNVLHCGYLSLHGLYATPVGSMRLRVLLSIGRGANSADAMISAPA